MTALLKDIIRLFPISFSTWVYTSVLEPRPLRSLANRFLKSIIPPSISIPEGTITLNPEDMAVSGQLALGVYENYETELFRSRLKDGYTVIDLGSNIGYYTVIAASRVGKNGRVFAFEPEPQNFSLLSTNVEQNKLTNVQTFKKAVSDRRGSEKLFLTKENRGTHSLVNNRNSDEYITVETDTLDSILNDTNIQLDILKMDIEGAEMSALQGMKNTITRSPSLKIFTAFDPKAISRFGHEPKKFLDELNALGFSISVINEDKKTTQPLPPEKFEEFIMKFPKNVELEKNLFAVRNPAVIDHSVTE